MCLLELCIEIKETNAHIERIKLLYMETSPA